MKRYRLRMAQWLMLSIVAYGVATWLSTVPTESPAGLFPRGQAVLWKCAQLNLAAFIGYWIDRHAFRDRICQNSHPLQHIRRAVIIGATMLGFGAAL